MPQRERFTHLQVKSDSKVLVDMVTGKRNQWQSVKPGYEIRYCTDTSIRKFFKNQDTIRLRYVNKKNYIIKYTI